MMNESVYAVGEINWGAATPTYSAGGVRAFCNDVLKYNLLTQTGNTALHPLVKLMKGAQRIKLKLLKSQTRRNHSAILKLCL
jgi:hypothetical protein